MSPAVPRRGIKWLRISILSAGDSFVKSPAESPAPQNRRNKYRVLSTIAAGDYKSLMKYDFWCVRYCVYKFNKEK